MRAVNLIPSDQLSGARGVPGRSQGAAYAVLALIAGFALLALLYGKADHQISSRRSQVAVLDQRAQQAQTAASALAPYTSFMSLREERMHTISQLVNSRFDWAHLMHEIGRVLPPLVTLTAIEGGVGSSSPSSSSSSSSKPSGTSATPAGTVPQFTLTGCAISQAEVADLLARLRLVDGASEVTLRSSTKNSGGGSTAAGGCKGPTFSAMITFQPLPAESTLGAATATPAAFKEAHR
jgi:Tfp pilus assembly protein PilN